MGTDSQACGRVNTFVSQYKMSSDKGELWAEPGQPSSWPDGWSPGGRGPQSAPVRGRRRPGRRGA